MNILFVAPYTPTPIRTRPYNLLRALVRLGHQLTLATLWEKEAERAVLADFEQQGVTVLARRLSRSRVALNLPTALLRGQPLQARYCWEPGLAQLLARAVAGGGFDVAHVEHLRGVEFGVGLQAAGRPLPIVWDSVDCITTLFERAARTSRSLFGRWITRLELPRTRRYEGQAVRRFNRVLATARFDAAALGQLAVRAAALPGAGPWANPAGAVQWLPNGVDLSYFAPGAAPRAAATVVLTGKMSYHANVTAAHFLIADIMPHVWAQRPDVRVNIIGSAPPPEIRALAARYAPLVNVSGYVADLRPYLQTATLAVAPVAYGAGIQNKVLEAMACEAPVVASPQAVAALHTQPGEHVLVAEGAAASAAAILSLLADEALCRRLGAAGRQYVAEHHDWHQVARQLQTIYHELVLPRLDFLIERVLELKHQRHTQRLPLRRQRQLLSLALVLTDITAIVLAFGAAFVVRFYSQLPIFQAGFTPSFPFYARLSLALLPLWLVLFAIYHLYDAEYLLGGTREYAGVFQASVTGTVIITFIQFLSIELIIARGWVFLAWAFTFVFVSLARWGVRRVAYSARRRGYLMAPTLLLGASAEGQLLAQQLLEWPTSGLNVLGFLDDEIEPGTRVFRNLYALGGLERLEELVENFGIEELILATSALSRETIMDVFQRYGTSPTVHLRLSSGLFELITTGLQVKETAYVPLIGVNRVRLTGVDVVLKTLLEYSLTTVAVLVLAPVMLVIGLLIKFDSPGPIFYRRRVMGLNGRQFDALKFRTMRVDGDAILAANPGLLDLLATTHKIRGDPRITRVGLVLRRFSLDELPQLFNVLLGDMALVGPRIISPPELKMYGQWAMNLLTVRPGLTGLWQVSGRSDIPYEDRVRLDMFYIRNYSLWLDLQLIMQTIPVVFSGRGAY